MKFLCLCAGIEVKKMIASFSRLRSLSVCDVSATVHVSRPGFCSSAPFLFSSFKWRSSGMCLFLSGYVFRTNGQSEMSILKRPAQPGDCRGHDYAIFRHFGQNSLCPISIRTLHPKYPRGAVPSDGGTPLCCVIIPPRLHTFGCLLRRINACLTLRLAYHFRGTYCFFLKVIKQSFGFKRRSKAQFHLQILCKLGALLW